MREQKLKNEPIETIDEYKTRRRRGNQLIEDGDERTMEFMVYDF